jgi:hypothetical protein
MKCCQHSPFSHGASTQKQDQHLNPTVGSKLGNLEMVEHIDDSVSAKCFKGQDSLLETVGILMIFRKFLFLF